jgi:hypothetical protein
MALFEEQERICRHLGDQAGLAVSLGNQANVLRDRGDLDRAMTLLLDVERIFREIGDIAGLQQSLGNRAGMLASAGRAREGLPIAEEAQRMAIERGRADLAAELQQVIDGLRLALKSDRNPPT